MMEMILAQGIFCPKKWTIITITSVSASVLRLVPRLYFFSDPQDVDNPIVHIFRSDTFPEEMDWLNSAWTAHGKPVRLPDSRNHVDLVSWHYRHCLINCWGSSTVKPRLYPTTFCENEENLGLAMSYYMESDEYIVSSPLPSTPTFQIYTCW